MKRCVAVCMLLLVLGCQPAAPARTAIWGEVPRRICTCHEDALARVETAVQKSQLALEYKIESGNDGWHVFSVTFDPTRMASQQVAQLLQGAGALIIAAPVSR